MGACIAENGLWMAFERMDCGSLLDYLKANPHLCWKTKVDILLQVANGRFIMQHPFLITHGALFLTQICSRLGFSS